jgi:vacuolar protein sorting-associated protein 41
VLPLGSIEPVEVGRLLQSERRGGDTNSHVFALELAFVLEHFSDNQQADAKAILELYLHGTQSIMLAVSYAQRNVAHSEILWEIVIDHCLSPTTKIMDDDVDETIPAQTFDGTLFGQLLEAAALSGADLAKIVRRIPAGMQVEGLKPRLVAAVADYRLKVQMHTSSSLIGAKEKLILLREVTQRTRRGVRHQVQWNVGPVLTLSKSDTKDQHTQDTKIILPFGRPKIRQDHTVLNFSLPIR